MVSQTPAGQAISETAKQGDQGTAREMQSQVGKTRNFEQAAQEVSSMMQGAPETVTSEDASYLKSREARATGQGQPPAGSISADAQRLASQNEKGGPVGVPSSRGVDPAIQSAADRVANFENVAEDVASKMATKPEAVTKSEADLAHSREQRAFGATSKGGIASQAQSLASENQIHPSTTQSAADRVGNFDSVANDVTDKLANNPGSITKEEADLAHSREQRAFGQTQKGGVASQAQSQANQNERSS